ncbi:hypothetical protein BHE74_00000703 [Ensete ventricosum]|nr:hypothetical protein BHE74_00000703 [Ensete ventricosum]RZS06660.1 hypothetical protein BHM03_00037355 [Ensete ventricosum]
MSQRYYTPVSGTKNRIKNNKSKQVLEHTHRLWTGHTCRHEREPNDLETPRRLTETVKRRRERGRVLEGGVPQARSSGGGGEANMTTTRGGVASVAERGATRGAKRRRGVGATARRRRSNANWYEDETSVAWRARVGIKIK